MKKKATEARTERTEKGMDGWMALEAALSVTLLAKLLYFATCRLFFSKQVQSMGGDEGGRKRERVSHGSRCVFTAQFEKEETC